MKLPDNPRERRAAIVAASVTFGLALVILVLLFIVTIGDDRRALAETSIPELQDDEEIFLEPEMLVVDNPGDEVVKSIDEPAPQTPGEPDPAETEERVRVVKNEEKPKEEPKSNKTQLVADNKESDVKSTTPKLTAEEEKRIASMQGKLKTDNNGSRTGKESANSGSGGEGTAFSGNVNGRKMLGCTTWKVRVTQKTVVTVNVTVDADGNVTKAVAGKGGTPNLRKECEKWAKTSKWTKKSGAPLTNGTITFTIIPQ